MSGITVHRHLIGKFENTDVAYFRHYPSLDRNKIIETKEISGESDFYTGRFERESLDGGITFGDWKDAYSDTYAKIGDSDEEWWVNEKPKLYDSKSGCFVTCAMQVYFVDGHEKCYEKLWSEGVQQFYDHCFLTTFNPETKERVRYPVLFDGGVRIRSRKSEEPRLSRKKRMLFRKREPRRKR